MGNAAIKETQYGPISPYKQPSQVLSIRWKALALGVCLATVPLGLGILAYINGTIAAPTMLMVMAGAFFLLGASPFMHDLMNKALSSIRNEKKMKIKHEEIESKLDNYNKRYLRKGSEWDERLNGDQKQYAVEPVESDIESDGESRFRIYAKIPNFPAFIVAENITEEERGHYTEVLVGKGYSLYLLPENK